MCQCRYLFALSLTDYRIVEHSASLRCAAAICLLRKLCQGSSGIPVLSRLKSSKSDGNLIKANRNRNLLLSVKCSKDWSPSLHYYTSYTIEDLSPMMAIYAKLLIEQPITILKV